MQTVDARGKMCPQPVIMTKKAIEAGASEIKVIVDNAIAGQNVTRLLKSKGFEVVLEAENDLDIAVTGVRGEGPSEGEDGTNPTEDTQERSHGPSGGSKAIAVIITKDILGGADRDLGEILIKGFLGTLHQLDDELIPETLAFMNEGVRLALKDSSTCESIIELEKKGCRILVCGTCVNHFGIADQVGVGEISNMFDISEAMLKADSILSL
ncbi:sulfurtransferase-like selenium metabolism protein YedF [Dethiosulfovibrio sp. F2B]|uniref:sulfurtransferase-like selenium metabolism protein YedF n=1 Tax=Dethiosulfovibrio faecalis TaxID=2720018 RepID=UPI001F1D01FA|nr:sulfurtransferase-like selenium metabolism protein YedF [Dethiosulfovibrio faecalis]MCF4150308.1 sulfurtransferase-like selenium metabolism protein YedF [Dethiosulfovibrio faecalis]